MSVVTAIILIISFVELGCIFRAVKDKIDHHYDETIFSNKWFNPMFWNPDISYKNKWKGGIKSNGEKFLFSSTALVFLTDAWHLFSSLELAAWHCAIAIGMSMFLPYSAVLILLALKVVYAVFFNGMYDKLLVKKFWS